MALSYRSSLLARASVRHGFSLRTGGVSEGAFASLNLGRAVGDVLSHVEENHRRLGHEVGYDSSRLYETSQVHGRAVRVIEGHEDPTLVRREEADALVTRAADIAIGIRIADCLPLLLIDHEAGVVGAVHAGWRGTASRIVDAALDAMALLGAKPEKVMASIGPHIRECCFEVGEEVVAALTSVAHEADFVKRSHNEKPHVDLAKVVRAQLLARGISDTNVDDTGGCTRCDDARFFSYRRDGKNSGRHLAVIASRAR